MEEEQRVLSSALCAVLCDSARRFMRRRGEMFVYAHTRMRKLATGSECAAQRRAMRRAAKIEHTMRYMRERRFRVSARRRLTAI